MREMREGDVPPSTRSAKEKFFLFLEDSLLANSPTIFTNANTLLGRGLHSFNKYSYIAKPYKNKKMLLLLLLFFGGGAPVVYPHQQLSPSTSPTLYTVTYGWRR